MRARNSLLLVLNDHWLRFLLGVLLILVILITTSCKAFMGAAFPESKPTPIEVVVQVDSYTSNNPAGMKYIIAPSDTMIKSYDLRFLEFSKIVQKALSQKGYTAVSDISQADLVVFMNYGISDPNMDIRSYSVPVWGSTGIKEEVTKGTSNYNSYSNQVNYQQSTVTKPSYGITGYRDQIATVTYYNRFITLSVFDFKEYQRSKQEKMVWNTFITSPGTSDDLRLVFPFMIIAGQDFFGKSSGIKQKMTILSDDERLKLLLLN